MIHSSLQSIALKAGLERRNLIAMNQPNQKNGLCDLTSKDLERMTEFLRNLPAASTVYDWLVKDGSLLARTLSGLLGAVEDA